MKKIIPLILAICMMFSSCSIFAERFYSMLDFSEAKSITINGEDFDFSAVPEFSNYPYVIINNNVPDFDEGDYTESSFETYGALDNLGRCTQAYACIGYDLMPTEKRGNIGSVKPTGWQKTKYKNVDGNYLFNRCHLIGYQLTAENANEKNLITGTRYMNTEGMLPFEDEVSSYVKTTYNHVLYRVTPLFKGGELVARGVQIEAYSVEDSGEGICFNVYCYNNQPDIVIDYKTGESKALNPEDNFDDENTSGTYIINIKSGKFHKPNCDAVPNISKGNKKKYTGERKTLIKNGYEPCGQCNP